MKDTLRTRLEFIWAKLAGRDINIDTLTPNAPTSMIEKLMLETAERISNSSGSGSGGTIIVETEWVDEGRYDKYYKTTMLADDIITAFISGKQIVFHTPDKEGWVFPETYLQLIGYSYPKGNLGEVFAITRDMIQHISRTERTSDLSCAGTLH